MLMPDSDPTLCKPSWFAAFEESQGVHPTLAPLLRSFASCALTAVVPKHGQCSSPKAWSRTRLCLLAAQLRLLRPDFALLRLLYCGSELLLLLLLVQRGPLTALQVCTQSCHHVICAARWVPDSE